MKQPAERARLAISLEFESSPQLSVFATTYEEEQRLRVWLCSTTALEDLQRDLRLEFCDDRDGVRPF